MRYQYKSFYKRRPQNSQYVVTSKLQDKYNKNHAKLSRELSQPPSKTEAFTLPHMIPKITHGKSHCRHIGQTTQNSSKRATPVNKFVNVNMMSNNQLKRINEHDDMSKVVAQMRNADQFVNKIESRKRMRGDENISMHLSLHHNLQSNNEFSSLPNNKL